jgi:Xaa-Pro aminopeptidase
MAATRPGGHEREIAALFDGVLAAMGCVPGYDSIVTVRGEVLHNPHHGNPLADGDLLLLDGGAERVSGYGTDVTRTWPVSGRFDARSRAAYEAVLAAQTAAIDLCRAGTRYQEVHLESARVLARWLCDENLLTCGVEEAVETGAHALFYPHGVGHFLGLDVHDMEQFGDRVSYAVGRNRADTFGLSYLRLDMDLEAGHLVTVEPGFYVVPAILGDARMRERHRGRVDFDRAENWLGFGGIRIEDDVLVTEENPEVLTGSIPKTVDDLEALVGSGQTAGERFGIGG